MNKYERQSIKKYGKIAKNYDGTFDGKFTAKFKETMLEFCNVADGDKILDVGCGNGKLIDAISRKADIQAYGIDISHGMIEECKARYKGINFAVSNAETLDFKNAELDTITICCVLHHLSSAQNFIKEAHRVLKPCGTLIIGEPWYPIVVKQFADLVVLPMLRMGDNKLFGHKKLKQLVIDGGFEITQIYKKGSMQIIKARKIT